MAVINAIERHGWKLLCHPAFLDPYLRLLGEVEKLREEHEDAYQSHPKAKLFARIHKLVFDEIPENPNAPEYKQGNTLGESRRHWRRAKFLGRFRLFFRFSSTNRVIIYAWVNDENTLRKAGSKADPYAVFGRQLTKGDPPDSWDELMRAAESLPGVEKGLK